MHAYFLLPNRTRQTSTKRSVDLLGNQTTMCVYKMLKPEHAVENDSLSGKRKLGKPKHLAARRQNAHLGSWARAVPRDMAFRSAGIACPSLRLRAVLGDVALRCRVS